MIFLRFPFMFPQFPLNGKTNLIPQQFRKLNHAFTAIELESRKDGSAVQAALGKITGAPTVSLSLPLQ